MNALLTTLLLVYVIYQNAADNSTYTTKYDSVDLDEILENERLLNGYVNCLLDVGPCTPDAEELKNNLPDAIQNNCSKCTDSQREGADKVIQYLIDNRPNEWAELEEKYDPQGIYKRKYLESKAKNNNTDYMQNTSPKTTET